MYDSVVACMYPHYLPYPLEYNHGVVFFNMSFWVRFNSKNPTKRGLFDQKMGVYSRKSPKTGLLKRGEVIFKSGAVLERIRYTNMNPPYTWILSAHFSI